MKMIRPISLLSLAAAIGLSACAPPENYDANGNYRGAADHGGGYQMPVSSDDHYYHSGNDNSNRHHKHNTVVSPEYDHNRDDYPGDYYYAPRTGY